MHKPLIVCSLFALAGTLAPLALPAPVASPAPRAATIRFSRDFCLDECSFSLAAENDYLPLVPGRFVVLEGVDEGQLERLDVTVLDLVRVVGGIPCRVVEEAKHENGELVEVSRLAYATDISSRNVYLMAQSVDVYSNGRLIGHDGSWEAYVNGAKPGLAMPGTILIGARYVLEEVPGIAEDRAEILEHPEPAKTPVKVFQNCVKIEETSALESDEVVIKVYAPGVGIVKDGTLKAIAHGG